MAVSPVSLDTVPEGVNLADGAALGIAGVTALRVLRKRSLLARRPVRTWSQAGDHRQPGP
ncbi:hypothetical protein [Streptomonospora salina]|uniref:NADPH:quinone reductase-like Zn-dependent oxidoreductase n=1 Tax=Streptomonospora salina TaxID=104205 RepID=A0A841EA41_9ACTN|nr:hypothetical protein [Streptomonospora salina]MBB6000887.1 NADPH:quinone reductase-like Zn-dependent oxidoreductase [Streptomonospora salina]